MKRQRNTKQFCFDFDIRFPKMPSYLRRSAIQHALGTVSSYKTRLDLWEKTDGKSGKPKLVYENHAMPVFYRDVMYREGAEGKDEAYRMYRTLGRIRRSQREYGSAQTQGIWAYTKRLNTELGKKTAGAIVRYAEENHADVIVFEYLEMQGKISGKKKQKLHLWRKRDIQRRCEHQAHRKEMRVSRICAWNTSRLAYDGSGAVTRDWENHSLCTFQTGKRYNCDLSASYNIGARYFIRELLKPLPATERSLLEAKVPPVNLPYLAWEMRITAYLSYRRIRRYSVGRLKRLEACDFSHVRFTTA